MLKQSMITISLLLPMAAVCVAQDSNTNSSITSPSTRTRTVAPSPTPAKTTPAKTTATKTSTKSSGTQTPGPKATPKPNQDAAGQVSPSNAVLAAFNSLLDGIRHTDVKAATGAYQNTPRLILFNYNGTVTRGWDQLKQNREASYPEMKDVKLDVKDLRVTMLGRDSALITCQWTQSMTFRGTPETDSGRMTIVFRKIGKDWKAIHLHTSPDKVDPARVPASEQTPPANP